MIEIAKPGPLASVQDRGRHGHRQLGICPGGALDTQALTVANRLVGNDDDAAGLELTMGNCEIRFHAPTRIALMGDAFGARLDSGPVPSGWSMPVEAGQMLRLQGQASVHRPGLRTWLAVAGGIDVEPMLGSRSTDLKAGFGGMEGRALRKGDRLPLGESRLSEEQRTRRAFGIRLPDDVPDQDGATLLRVMAGPEASQFTLASLKEFHSQAWRITPQSNRMGSRLQSTQGIELKRKRGVGDMLSSGVIPGTVQVPPSGQPIILMGDSQTTGGYPRVAVVIRADLWKLAQAPLGGLLRLQEVDAAAALAAWDVQQRYLSSVALGLTMLGWPVAPTAPTVAAEKATQGDPADGN